MVGIQYLTAGGNEEQTRKAKRRMLEIVIGIVAYVILYAGLRWLLPEFNGTSQPNKESNSSQVEADTNGYTDKTCAEAGKTWVWADKSKGTGYCKVY